MTRYVDTIKPNPVSPRREGTNQIAANMTTRLQQHRDPAGSKANLTLGDKRILNFPRLRKIAVNVVVKCL